VAKAGVSRVDEYLVRYAESRSLREIAAMLGGVVTPEALAARLNTILDTRGFLSDAQRERRILIVLEDTLAEIDEAFQDKDMLKIKLTYLREISARLDKRKDALDADLNRLYGNQGAIMAHAYDVAMTYLKATILHAPDGAITEERWDELQIEALNHARTELAKYEIEA